MTRQELTRKLLDFGIIHKGKVTLRSGKETDFYIDLKKAYGYPKLLATLVAEMNKLVPQKTTCVATIGQGGIPLAVLVSQKLNLKLALVRDKPRKHGTRKIIDGHVPSQKDKVVIVDDVFTTGSSIRDVVGHLRPTGCKIVSAAVVVKRGAGKVGLPLAHLLTLKDLTD
ncbi:MAG: hypothetical protein A3G45_00305 [Candidatus Staskawiczbacteria bacterium RIFCSPLOWO2_12_FULL_37_15]|uniref:Orotate phosphoribosyltransferase n=1 Tax=Candidatus Staskawiczbacteria bacterium RIFCSPLOWO2_12_FULL_37_15 TaxID=1802218 RepID=A0A1G2IQ69_9BACT|nr:MAG: hypothetical protein A3G45_00305 [Candidatus Staskawiczbacteria bacterium RIFCSPLOWO2_12_FULL_37_15]OHA25915.1 MAG: hypothetical protein A3D52_02970 [Candidatus Taylorbacteria bacterium RIFCSPHIGHO2_02_FULL_44_36]HXK41024.1 phosphoribosyltransferase family protein [Candidatus Paceibacterota bacterium]